MEKENKGTPVRIVQDTYEKISNNKGNMSFAQFIAEAVDFYIKNKDIIPDLWKFIEVIKTNTQASMGLQLEVLKSLGVLDIDGSLIKKN